MKVRQGFVSNSSSSSFVVAFPKEPKSADEVLKMMFPEEKPEGVYEVFDHKATYQEIAERVWQDIEAQNKREPEPDDPKTPLEKVTESFYHRYWVMTGGTIDIDLLCNAGIVKEIPYCQSDEDSYFGTKDGQLQEIKKWELEQDALWAARNRNVRLLQEQLGLEDPKYKPNSSKEEEEQRLKKMKANREKMEATEEFKQIQSLHHNQYEYIQAQREKAIEKAAKTDAKAFLKANKGAFILYTHYADDCESLMEHGEVFFNLKHVVISHH